MVRLALHQLNNVRYLQSLPPSGIFPHTVILLLSSILFTLNQGTHEALHLIDLLFIQQSKLVYSLPLFHYVSQINFLKHLPKLLQLHPQLRLESLCGAIQLAGR